MYRNENCFNTSSYLKVCAKGKQDKLVFALLKNI